MHFTYAFCALFFLGGETRELTDGYAFRSKSEDVGLSDSSAWILYESRCCPFFTFEVELESKQWSSLAQAERN